MTADSLHLQMISPLKAQNAGLFIARGTAMHPTRVIDSHELIFVKHGELDMWEDDQTFHLEAGQVLHLFPHRQHGSSKPMPLGLKFYWIHFEVETTDRRRCGGVGFAPEIEIPQVTQIRHPERLERLFRTFLEDQETGMLQAASANLLTTLMLLEVAVCAEEKAADQEALNFIASRAQTYIRLNFDRSITTSKIATALGYNADYLGRIYRKVYGCTLTQAIHRKRVDIACDYLLETNMTIEQIALKCGFPDADYFRRVFRRCMGISPGNYRDEYSRFHINTH